MMGRKWKKFKSSLVSFLMTLNCSILLEGVEDVSHIDDSRLWWALLERLRSQS